MEKASRINHLFWELEETFMRGDEEVQGARCHTEVVLGVRPQLSPEVLSLSEHLLSDLCPLLLSDLCPLLTTFLATAVK